MPGVSGAVGVALPMVLRSGGAGSSPERGPGQMGVQGWGWSAEGGHHVSPGGDSASGAWCQPGLGIPSLPQPGGGGHSIPRFDASLLQTTPVTSAERPGASPAGELGHMGDSACARGSARAWGRSTPLMLWSPRETGLPAACPPMLDIQPPPRKCAACGRWAPCHMFA